VSNRLPAAARRRQLLEVAVAVFAVRGFHATSMNDVADAAGVTKPVLYQHFSSKRHLYLQALTEVGNRLRQAIEKATANAASPRDQVREGLLAYFRFVAEDKAAFALLFGGGTRRDAEFARAAGSVERAIAASIASLITVSTLSEAERGLLAHAIVGLAEGASRNWIAQGMPVDLEQLAAMVAQLAWSGLRSVGHG
jgi:AcrR family transcriptional regulator